MKPPAFAYHGPTSVDEAVATLGELGADGKVLAGGQSLVPLMNMRLASPAALVDIERLDELDRIEVTADAVRVGARVRHARLHRDAEAAAAIPLLRQALDWVAHPVIRNRGTSVGSIVHADPAAELPAVLALLDGEVEMRSTAGTRRCTAADFVTGPLECDARVGELVTAVSFRRPPPRTGSAFVELSRRHGDYALAGAGVLVTVDEDRHVTAARATFIGVSDTPVVIDLAEALGGQAADDLDLEAARGVALARIEPDGDIHATADYRRHLAGVMLGRALTEAAGHATDDTADRATGPATDRATGPATDPADRATDPADRATDPADRATEPATDPADRATDRATDPATGRSDRIGPSGRTDGHRGARATDEATDSTGERA